MNKILEKRRLLTKRERKKPSSLSRSIFYSALFHFFVIAVILLFPSDFFIEQRPPIDLVWVELPKGTSEDDIYGLKEVKRLPETTPEQDVAETKPIKPIDEKKIMPEPKKEEKKAEKKPVKKVVKPSGMNSALAKIDQRLKKRTEPEAAQVNSTGEGYKYGTSDKPLRVARDDAELLKYRALIRARVMSQWVVPSSLYAMSPDIRPVVRIIVHINKGGNVISKSYAKRSGVEALNASAMRAIDRASPFPIPPERIKWEAYNEGFLVEFNARNR